MLYRSMVGKVRKRIKDWTIEHLYVIALKEDIIVGIKKMGTQSISSVSLSFSKMTSYLYSRDADSYIIVHSHTNRIVEHSYCDVVATNLCKIMVPFEFKGSLVITKSRYEFVPSIWGQ